MAALPGNRSTTMKDSKNKTDVNKTLKPKKVTKSFKSTKPGNNSKYEYVNGRLLPKKTSTQIIQEMCDEKYEFSLKYRQWLRAGNKDLFGREWLEEEAMHDENLKESPVELEEELEKQRAERRLIRRNAAAAAAAAVKKE